MRLSANRFGSKYWFTYGFGICFLSYFSVAGYLWSTQVEQILRPVPGQKEIAWTDELDCECLEIPLPGPKDGQCLNAVFLPAADADAPVILMLHGQGTTIEWEVDRASCFRDVGCSCLLVEYRGFGPSYGEFRPTEASLVEDAQVALDYLRSNRQVAASRTFVYGHSLGGGVAFSLVDQNPQVAGLIVESTFTSILDMSSLEYNGWLNLIPVDLLLSERFDSHAKVPNLQVPLLIFHGTDDSRIPLQMAKQLHHAAQSRKQICVIDGAGHANCFHVGGDDYREAVASFVKDCLIAEPTG